MRLVQSVLTGLGLSVVMTGLAGRAAETDKRADTPSRQNAQSSAPTIQVYSRETVVDVIVTDSKGKPVVGLKQSDFTVKEDGNPQPIRSFKESGDGVSVPRELPKLPPGVYSNAHATPETGPVNVLLIDVLSSSPTQVLLLKKDVVKYLKSMPPGAPVAVFALSANKGLRLVQGFTTDGAVVAAGVEEIDEERVRMPAPEADRMTWEAMNQIAAYSYGIKGRKNLMWFTASMPIPIYRDHDRTTYVSFEELEELYDRFLEDEVAVYPVDLHAVDTGMPSIASNGDLNQTMLANATQVAKRELRLERVAEATGGVALYNSNDFGSLLAKAFENGAHYYTLTYVPPPLANDTRYHTIDVKVDRPGVHLTYRKGFNADDPLQQMSPADGPKLMQASMGRGVPPSTELLFDVRVQPNTEPLKPTDPVVMGTLNPALKKVALSRYSFLYLLPVSQIAFADGPDGTHTGSLEFDVSAYDADGKLATMLSQTMKLPLTKEEYQEFLKTPFQFFQQLDLPPGQFSLRIGVLDGVSNKVGTMEVPLTVGKPAAAVASGEKAQ